MEFNYNGSTSAFSLVSIQNEIDLEASCYRCTRFSALSWTQLQVSLAASNYCPTTPTQRHKAWG